MQPVIFYIGRLHIPVIAFQYLDTVQKLIPILLRQLCKTKVKRIHFFLRRRRIGLIGPYRRDAGNDEVCIRVGFLQGFQRLLIGLDKIIRVHIGVVGTKHHNHAARL